MPRTRITPSPTGIRIRLDPDLRIALGSFARQSGLPSLSAAIRTALRLGLRLIDHDQASGFRTGLVEGRMEGARAVRIATAQALSKPQVKKVRRSNKK